MNGPLDGYEHIRNIQLDAESMLLGDNAMLETLMPLVLLAIGASALAVIGHSLVQGMAFARGTGSLAGTRFRPSRQRSHLTPGASGIGRAYSDAATRAETPLRRRLTLA